jgi:hypothetical protein
MTDVKPKPLSRRGLAMAAYWPAHNDDDYEEGDSEGDEPQAVASSPRPIAATATPIVSRCPVCDDTLPSTEDLSMHFAGCWWRHSDAGRASFTCRWCKQHQEFYGADAERRLKIHCQTCFLTKADEFAQQVAQESRLQAHLHTLGSTSSRTLAQAQIWDAYNEAAERFTAELASLKQHFSTLQTIDPGTITNADGRF